MYNDYRRKTREIQIGDLKIGGKNDILIQSMTNTKTSDFDSTYSQIKKLEDAGCDIVRITVPDRESVDTIYRLKSSDIRMPLVADIHFDYRLAIESAEAGIDKIRINPGNIGGEDRIREVCSVCRRKIIPIRIGVNSGSLEKHLLEKFGSPSAQALFESAKYNIELLERFDFENIVVAIKSSDVKTMIEANRMLAEYCDYPIHLGVTEAGSRNRGIVKSSIGIGTLLCDGIGDTLRVSLTSDPVYEIDAAKDILMSLNIMSGNYIDLTSCPTCGRTKVDLIKIVNEFENRSRAECRPSRRLHVAIMGCAVNGPGEAREADIGIAGGEKEGLLFKKGEIIRKIPEDRIVDELIEEINRL